MIKRLYGEDGYVDGAEWELFLLENPTPDERMRWTEAMDVLFPPAMPDRRSPPPPPAPNPDLPPCTWWRR